MTTTLEPPLAPGAKPLTDRRRNGAEQFGVYAFVVIPLLAVGAAVPFAWGWGLGWVDVGIALAFYMISGLGVTVGYHRLFTHGSFRAKRGLKIALAAAGGLSAQGSVIEWVADHRRHHAFSDKEGDPHSPWLFGTGPVAIARGFWHSHVGWLFDRDCTTIDRFAPDLAADADLRAVDRMFIPLTVASLTVPALLGGLLTWSWWGMLTAFFWAGLVRIALLHHVTWSVNSVCHMMGDRPFKSRDKAANVWPLAILSFGESWHNLHHADPTSARHGVLRGQLDISARVIWIFEKLGWASNVRWPTEQRIDKLRVEKALAK
ncbi:Fatty acid desaturase; Delta-9 fatty acid desaturase [Alloactinosynnema sp. L-07]|uniref:acyl-CoA desaturase n=1 Tax=Alloactinosynnema sp. L-07 TaxID=1653480 RepID=UPI00065F0335|nr:acyl-CoA desaturase [Alloactinosynnema sp. L-07]CRK55845.1 Fatty acid desaturase; Delta-9 fatty acid desaturase [Alloactinosynnema sp. L-07]